MYSFNAIPVCDTIHSHVGFYVILTGALIVSFIALMNSVEDFLEMGFFCLIFVVIAAIISWTTGSIKTYENEEKVGKFISYQPEGYNERSGKTRADHHYMYVVYEVDGQMVILKAIAGQSYPKNAILYKNSNVKRCECD